MAATICAALARNALDAAATVLHDLSDYRPSHPEAERMHAALASMDARAAALIEAGDPEDDLGPLMDDLSDLQYCAENWMWAADNCGSARVTCRDVLDRYAPLLPLMIPAAAPLRIAA